MIQCSVVYTKGVFVTSMSLDTFNVDWNGIKDWSVWKMVGDLIIVCKYDCLSKHINL